MTIGEWLYYRRKFKLITIKNFGFPKKNKSILALTYERNWNLPAGWSVKYFDIRSPFTAIRSPDLVIEREFNDGKAEYEYLYKQELNKVPKAFWFIDTHISSIERIRYCDNFDFVFVAQSPYLEHVRKNTRCKNIFWLPLCYPGDPSEIKKNVSQVKYLISFVGRFEYSYEERYKMISFLKEEYQQDFFAVTDYNNMRAIISQSKITTNYSIKDDLNFRVFESLALGVNLVTNYVPDLDKIEGLSERSYHFKDNEELKKKIDNIIAGKFLLKYDTCEIQDWVKQKHTMKQRLAEMLEMINTGKQVEYK